MKLSQLLAEDKVDDTIGHDYKIKVKDAMFAISKEIGRVIGKPSYRVAINLSAQQSFMHRRYGVNGMMWVLNVGAPEEHDSNFFGSMIGKLLKRELAKRFSRSAILDVHVSEFTSSDGDRSFDSVFVTFMVPDVEGTFSVNSTP